MRTGLSGLTANSIALTGALSPAPWFGSQIGSVTACSHQTYYTDSHPPTEFLA
jgi:hypothetical protein